MAMTWKFLLISIFMFPLPAWAVGDITSRNLHRDDLELTEAELFVMPPNGK